MARYLANVAALKAFMERKLGGENWVVEISTDQWNDIFFSASEEFYEYSDWGLTDDYFIVDPQGQDVVILADNVRSITACYGTDSVGNVADIAYPSDSLYYTLIVNGATDFSLSSYVVMKQYLNTFKELFKEPIVFKFNSETKKLKLLNSGYQRIAFRAEVEEPIDGLVNNKYFRMLVEEKALRQWAMNIGLKYDVENAPIMGNGLKLNTAGMLESADKLREELLDGIENEEWGTSIPPRKLYD